MKQPLEDDKEEKERKNFYNRLRFLNEKPSVRCRCKENSISDKLIKPTVRTEGRPLLYPLFEEKYSKIFQVKYEKTLTIKAKLILDSFRNKYIYYAIDDIIDNFKFNSKEADNLLSILYSSMLYLHNNLYINFFDIWIEEIYINEKKEPNRFLKTENENSIKLTNITLKLCYRTRLPFKKPDPLW